MTDAFAIIDAIFDLDPAVRYVALYRDGVLTSRQRSDLDDASDSESDRYEELLVNPALLLLTGQRGDIDCGGRRFLVVRYGNFYQFVASVPGGHVSVCIALGGDPLGLADAIVAHATSGTSNPALA